MRSEEINESTELTFLGTDPGAVKHGNFINYYTFHNVDERISKLHPDMFQKPTSNKIVCMDIGCNTGELTNELYNYLKTAYTDLEIHILGIDIDPTLIKRAQESNKNPNIAYLPANIVEEKDVIENYLTANCKKKFDMTFCFSVTMWIHLNNGDAGLIDFLKYIRNISNTIIIEPQPWNCYRNAQRRLKKSGSTFEYYENLKIRSNVAEEIEKILVADNYCKKVYESPQSSWNRKIQSYHCLE